MTRTNAYVVVNCAEIPAYGGDFDTLESVFDYYNDRYATFTGRVFTSLRSANREMHLMDSRCDEMGYNSAYVACGVHCSEID